MRMRVAILQVALHRITVTVVRLLTVQPDCKTAGVCNLRQIILSSVIIYACHIKQSTDNQCASTMYFVTSEYSIVLQPCQALICLIDTKCKQCRIFCRVYTVSPGIPDWWRKIDEQSGGGQKKIPTGEGKPANSREACRRKLKEKKKWVFGGTWSLKNKVLE